MLGAHTDVCGCVGSVFVVFVYGVMSLGCPGGKVCEIVRSIWDLAITYEIDAAIIHASPYKKAKTEDNSTSVLVVDNTLPCCSLLQHLIANSNLCGIPMPPSVLE